MQIFCILTISAYIRESTLVRCFSNAYLQECLILEISINNKKGYVVSLYRSPSQTLDEFDSFFNNFEKRIIDIYNQKADFVLIIGDFNAKSCNWCSARFSFKTLIILAELYTDDTSIFSVVHNSFSSSLPLSVDLSKISQWEQSQEIVFSRKREPSNHNDIYFNNVPLNRKYSKTSTAIFRC